MFKLKMLSQVVAATVASSFLVGCGGGSSSGTAASTTTNVSGSAFASYVSDARVVAMDGTAEIAGPVTTSATGRFTLPIPNEHLRSELVFVATGGTYIDEATGQEAASGELAVVAGANTLQAGSSIHATPSSTIIKMLMKKHGKTKDEAEKAFEAAFGYLPNTAVAPVDATKANDDASEDAKRAGVRAAAFSQLLKNLGLDKGDHSALLAALAEDLADGKADGMNKTMSVQLKGGDLNVDISNQYAMAKMGFIKGGSNKSGLNLGKFSFPSLNSKVTLETEGYTFEIEPQKMASVGKATYSVKVTDGNDQPATGTPEVSPVMYMSGGHMHNTPQRDCTPFVDGESTCTVYYLMPSSMGGNVMGTWDLEFSVGAGGAKESVHFVPNVMMAMGDTASVTFKGEGDDTYQMMGKALARPYIVFKDSLMEMGGDQTLKLFVAARYGMMSHPALTDNGTEIDGDLKPATVELFYGETKDDVTNKTNKAIYSDGLWSLPGIDWLTDGEQGSVFVGLDVDGDSKVHNEGTVGEFKVTPGSNSMNMSM